MGARRYGISLRVFNAISRIEHEKTNSISPSNHVLLCLENFSLLFYFHFIITTLYCFICPYSLVHSHRQYRNLLRQASYSGGGMSWNCLVSFSFGKNDFINTTSLCSFFECFCWLPLRQIFQHLRR